VIFIDGDYWHGNNWKIRKLPSLEDELANYSDFWKNKIKAQIQAASAIKVKQGEVLPTP
jgi:G:T-mismatch repair DNA endonuclease (very short patch repair protein)